VTKRQCIKIIEDLEKLNALMLVVWRRGCRYPRLWLKDWCGAKTSVSIATAEMIRDAIRAGEISPGTFSPGTPRRKLPAYCPENYVETVFVR